MKINFGRVFIQKTIREYGNIGVENKVIDLMQEGTNNNQYKNKDYFITEFEYLNPQNSFSGAEISEAYKVEAYKNSKKVGEQIYPIDKFVKTKVEDILELNEIVH